MINLDLQKRWTVLIKQLEQQFGEGLDLDAVLFLIGVQELGQGFRTFSKNEKIDLMHIAICRVLVQYGYYEYLGVDGDGWPHYEALSKLPKLNPNAQSMLMKEAILDYFENSALLN
ncbi:hypothetical protein ACFLR1_00650 [Bacteroidota bacterium]